MSGIFKLFHYFLSGHKTIFTHIQLSSLIQCSVIIKNINCIQFMFEPNLIIIFIVCRGNLQATCTKFNIHIIIFDNRYWTIYQRHQYFFSRQMFETFIIGINTNGCIPKNGLRTGCGNGYPVAL